VLYIPPNRREEFECTHHKEMIKVWGHRYTNYPELITTQRIHESEPHTVAHKYANIMFIKKL
jgi:hypothetical protein